MRELRELSERPHPAFDIYPSENNLESWKVVMTAPDNTSYAGGTFLFCMDFRGGRYPLVPPSICFVTPICHPLVGTDGVVCREWLEKGWTCSTSIELLLQRIYGLLRNKSFHFSYCKYAVQRFAKKDRRTWRAELQLLLLPRTAVAPPPHHHHKRSVNEMDDIDLALPQTKRIKIL